MENEAQLRLDEGLEQDNSDSVNDSQTGDPRIKEALFNLNENMGKMPGLLEHLYNRPCSKDCDRPPGSKRRRRSRSPDSRSADEDEPRGKRRCNSAEDVDNEDRLSVDAVSDIDSDIRLLTRESDAQPQVNDHGELDENLLKELDESLDQKEAIGPPVKQLAEIANKRWGQNLTQERVKMLNERYSTPANCTNMTPIMVNPEIWKQLILHPLSGKPIYNYRTYKKLFGGSRLPFCKLQTNYFPKIRMMSPRIWLLAQ